jgi:hypothetical protein
MRFITLLNNRILGGFERESAALRRDEGRFATLNPGFPSSVILGESMKSNIIKTKNVSWFKMAYYFFIVVIVGWGLFYAITYFTRPSVIFLTKNELLRVLKSDNDGYYSTFTSKDLQVRNVSSVEEYVNVNVEESVDEFSDYEKNMIRQCIYRITPKINEIQYGYFNGKKCNSIPWKIGCVKGKSYEAGLPHTRKDIIILPKELLQNLGEDKLSRVLFHEKIHVYQKVYPKDAEIYVNQNGFYKTHKKNGNQENNYRANPDVDDWIYYDKSTGRNGGAIYNENATFITDVRFAGGKDSTEHPFEQMAYRLEKGT